MASVLIAGVAVADVVLRVEQFPQTPEKYRADDALVTIGGCAANAAIAVARLGGKAKIAARLGDDFMGDLIINSLMAEGVDVSLCDRRKGARSSFSSVLIDAAGERQIVNFRGADLAPALDFSNVVEHDAVLADNRWSPLCAQALRAARDWRVPGIVDAEAPFEISAVEDASHIAFSMQGLSSYAPGISAAQGLERAQDQIGAWAAVTDGENGTFFTGRGQVDQIPAFEVEVIDTLAAGDVWHGAFALALAEGKVEDEAITFANAAAALKCRSFGGAAGCPSRTETEQFMKERAQWN